MKNQMVIAAFLISLLILFGCSGSKDVKKSLDQLRTGTEGVAVSFLPYNPPNVFHVSDNDQGSNTFDILLEIKNKGAYPQPEQGTGPEGKVFLSGFDANILQVNPSGTSNDLSKRALEGKSVININGGTDIVTFKASIPETSKLTVEKYDLTLLATACYMYETIAGPSVCIDPIPYSTLNEKKTCQISDLTLSGQGAPIAVTKISEEAFAEKTQFRITIKNVGGGDVIKSDDKSFEKCDPFGGKIEREDIDKVKVEEIKISDTELECRPFAEGDPVAKSGYVRLINGEGSIACELTKDNYDSYQRSKTTFTTPLNIKLSYMYRTTGQRTLQLKKEISSS